MGNGPAINDIVADAFKESGEGSSAIQEGAKGIGSLPTGPSGDGGDGGKKKKGPKHIAAKVDAGSGSIKSGAAISKKKSIDKAKAKAKADSKAKAEAAAKVEAEKKAKEAAKAKEIEKAKEQPKAPVKEAQKVDPVKLDVKISEVKKPVVDPNAAKKIKKV